LVFYLLSKSTILCNMFYFVILITFFCVTFFLQLFVFFCHISICVTFKISWSSIFIKIILSLPNIYGYISCFICYSYSCSIVILTLYRLVFLSGAVHTGVEVRRMDSEMSGLVKRPWLQLMCCAVCLPRGRNFRWRRGSLSGSEC